MPRARLYSVVPRSSVWPARTARRKGVLERHCQSSSSVLRASGVKVASSKPKYTARTWHSPRRRSGRLASRSPCALQSLLTQALPSPQSASARQSSSAAHRPEMHFRPWPQSRAAVSGAHSATHFSLSHFCPAAQSALEAHCGLAVQSASRQTGRPAWVAQLESSRHSLQKPLRQTWPWSLQSSSILHSGYWTLGHPQSTTARTRSRRRIARPPIAHLSNFGVQLMAVHKCGSGRRAHRTSRAVPQRSPRTWRSRSRFLLAFAALDASRPERRGYRTAFGRHSPLMNHLRFVTAASPWSLSESPKQLLREAANAGERELFAADIPEHDSKDEEQASHRA